MTTNTTPSNPRVTAAAVTRHDCAERGCLAAMLGLALSDTGAIDIEEGTSSNW